MAAMTAAQYDTCVQPILAADLHLNTIEAQLRAIQDRRLSEAFTLLILGKIEQCYRPGAPSVHPSVVNSHQAFKGRY
jgi:hypothetical protein